MFAQFRKMKLSTRIILQGVAISVLYLGLVAWIYPHLEETLYQGKYVKTKEVVESAWGVIDHFYKKAQKGELSVEAAQEAAKDAVRNLRYEGDNYFWINDFGPKMVMHPMNPDLEGKDISNAKDSNGKNFFVEFVNVVRSSGEGYVPYEYAKPGTNEVAPKISYVKGVTGWQWLIGSGVYLDDVEAELSSMVTTISIVVLVIVSLAFLLSWAIARSIAGPIDLAVEGLRAGSEQVSTASGEIASSSQNLAQGATEQASSIEETSASLEELSSMTKQNAENSEQANRLMHEANTVILRADEAMKQLTTAMGEISTAGKQTQGIVKTIDDISFQTNLLALNAAVEAARAGAAGAGFAVVADEVRNLAMRAAEAAKNTSSLVDGILQKISGGSELVGVCSKSFVEVKTSADSVGSLLEEISAASKEQSTGINHINKAVVEMEKVVQTTAASAEESAAVSEEMSAQAGQMTELTRELVRLVRGEKAHTESASKAPAIVSSYKPVARPAPQVKPSRSPASQQKKVNGQANPKSVIPLEESDFHGF
jgi:methyl-accepting chemotaxis protein